jgi:hypothetical protein
MVPAFDDRGLLPPGIWEAESWAEVEDRFVFNEHRQILLAKMVTWVDAELQHVAAGLDLVLGGSFLTTKPAPGDIDCTVIIPVEEIAERGAALQLLLVDGRKGRIYEEYRVEAYPTLRAPGASDFSAYFQYVGEKSAVLHRCAALDLRGVIKVTSWQPG